MLKKNWITDTPLDIEHKIYLLLDFFQTINNNFNEFKLYPHYDELYTHYYSLKDFQGKPIVGVDLNNNDNYISDLNKVVEITIKLLAKKINEGENIYIEVNKVIDILNMTDYISDNGYFILENGGIFIYEYNLIDDELVVKLIRKLPNNYGISYESIKNDLLNSTKIKNPPIYLIDSPIQYPLNETLLPIVKLLLIEKIG